MIYMRGDEMTKVRVTQEQADVLHKVAKMVKDIPADKVIRALEKGFEVEPEFKEGDWVIRGDTGQIGQVTGFGTSISNDDVTLAYEIGKSTRLNSSHVAISY